jgi:hypothetical protein
VQAATAVFEHSWQRALPVHRQRERLLDLRADDKETGGQFFQGGADESVDAGVMARADAAETEVFPEARELDVRTLRS